MAATPSLAELRRLAEAQGVAPTDDDLEAVRAFLRYTSNASRGWLDGSPAGTAMDYHFGDIGDPDSVMAAVEDVDGRVDFIGAGFSLMEGVVVLREIFRALRPRLVLESAVQPGADLVTVQVAGFFFGLLERLSDQVPGLRLLRGHQLADLLIERRRFARALIAMRFWRDWPMVPSMRSSHSIVHMKLNLRTLSLK